MEHHFLYDHYVFLMEPAAQTYIAWDGERTREPGFFKNAAYYEKLSFLYDQSAFFEKEDTRAMISENLNIFGGQGGFIIFGGRLERC